VRRVYETEQIIAFHHPSPSWPFHVLFVPKVGIASFLDIRPEHVPLVGDLVQLAVATASQSGVEAGSFALMANGGAYQDVGQLHSRVGRAGTVAGMVVLGTEAGEEPWSSTSALVV
jgi:histidine triad (HIT) family protein